MAEIIEEKTAPGRDHDRHRAARIPLHINGPIGLPLALACGTAR
ncbi:MAG: hypothetical protein ACOX3E_09580 [Desulfomonilia bacterium]|nr:hypothetical protein [Pseudomonadota bacterium]HON37196.1 hypothetical protein [Deltaproteobacteria bacterium]HRS54982.1 hypothetical protein [Desulfomonilia bacterium]HPD20046.1 hypothetical protein [Deltaproteobacteria bacterium]HPX18606.1 hypothetical protein [Deltaproteobacteria bacterium]